MSAGNDPRLGLHLVDLVALVVGYSLASLLVRAFWPAVYGPEAPGLFILGLAFLWLGLAMSGPVLLMGHRRGAREPGGVDSHESRTWAEMAWLIIGFYWIGLTILVVPVRLHNTQVLDSAFLGVFPILAAVGLKFVRPRSFARVREKPDWTHQVAVGLLVTWPFAWVALILLGKSLP